MAQQTLTNGETYGSHRSKANANFTELYAGVGSPVSSVAGRTGAVTLTQADVTANAPVSISNATTLTAASHANRQLIYSGTTATLAISNDATGGWAGDMDVMIQTASGSAGVPTISTPDGKTVTGSATQPIGARRKAANEWDVYLLPQSTPPSSGTVITHLTDYTATSNYTSATANLESSALKTVTVGALSAGQRVRIVGTLTGSNTNDATTLRIKLGGTTVGTLVTGIFSVLDGFWSEIVCTGSATQMTISQKTFSGGTLASTVKTTVNTSSSVDLTLTLSTSNTSRTSAIEALDVEVYPA